MTGPAFCRAGLVGGAVVLGLLMLSDPSVLSRNRLAVELRDQLLDGLPDAGAGRGLLTGAHHRYALAVAQGRWVDLADDVNALPDARLVWHGDGLVPPTAYAAVLQRAAEQLAATDPARAATLGSRAKALLAWRRLEPDPGNLARQEQAGNTMAATLERRRIEAGAGRGGELANGAFTDWMAPEGIIPGWMEERGAVRATAQPDAVMGRALTLCTATASTLRNETFEAQPGRTYRLSLSVRSLGGTQEPTVLAGVRYLDGERGEMQPVYVFAARPTQSWTTHTTEWTMPRSGTEGRFVITVAVDAAGQCVAIAAVTATLLP